MRQRLKHWIALSVASSLLMTLPGCWDYQSINTRASLSGIGVDPISNDPDKLHITIQFPVFSQSDTGPSGTQASSSTSFKSFSAEGYSLSEVLRQLQLQMDKQIETAQVRAIVISQKLSPAAMDSFISQVIRQPKMNRLAFVVSTPKSAEEVLKTDVYDGAPMDFLDKIFSVRQQGYAVRRQLWEFWRDNTQLGVVPVIPVVESVNSKDKQAGALRLTGIEVYVYKRPTLRMSRLEALHYNFLSGRVRDMALNIPYKDGVVALSDVRATHRLRSIGQGSDLRFVDEVSIRGTLAKLHEPTQKPIPPAALNDIQSVVSQYLVERLTDTVKKLQQHQADIFGFGRVYLRTHPEAEQHIRKDWGSMFSRGQVEVKVKVLITGKGMLI